MNAESFRSFQAEVPIHDFAVAARKYRDLEAIFSNRRDHGVDGAIILARIRGIKNKSVGRPQLNRFAAWMCGHGSPSQKAFWRVSFESCARSASVANRTSALQYSLWADICKSLFAANLRLPLECRRRGEAPRRGFCIFCIRTIRTIPLYEPYGHAVNLYLRETGRP